MTSIDDLRATLEARASGTADAAGLADVVTRQAAVHRRIRTVRRRRAAGATAVAAVAAVVVGVTVGGPGERGAGIEPATPAVFGVDVPRELDSLGFTYDYVDHVADTDEVTLDLPASETPRLVSWGTTADQVAVDGIADRLVLDGSDFTDWSYVPTGAAFTVTAEADGEVALAVYELGEERPSGVAADGTVFRDVVGDRTLLGARIGDTGEGDIGVEGGTAEDAGMLAVRYFCTDASPGAWVHFELAGEPTFDAACGSDQAPPIDVGGAGGSAFEVTAGEDLTGRLFVTDGKDGPVVDDPDVRLGLGLYRVAPPVEGLPPAIEHDGHAWQLRNARAPRVIGDEATAPVPDLGERVLAVVSSGRLDGVNVSWAIDGVRGSSQSQVGGSFSFDVPLGAREVSLVRVSGGQLDPDESIATGFYVRAD